ncbi:hypothetical protein SS50377_28401 [Spironucleus salmonicida]|uniref:Uncharacterized protein n=1 Tax=Spironucleus salmonicida TaxID=348837 RepID=A0A9P8LK13_9EUKA|nr:hypothetical protein SS50377_28394 [Spironucleus salmonicida]KAH0569448.1 hypothetical protein SS50377_28397 [Spironucleus salmonicida]KAH0569452.1 hypothetical protein SS50377_28401 [Spironucleus salmonicida]
MPRASLDQTSALSAIAQALRSLSVHTASTLLRDHALLSQEVSRVTVPWQHAADIMGVTKSRLYHWYRETFQRRQQEPLSASDAAVVKHMVQEAAAAGFEPSLDMVRARLSRKYDTQVLRVAFQNAKAIARSAMPVIPKLALPFSRPDFDSLSVSPRVESCSVTPRDTLLDDEFSEQFFCSFGFE